MLDFIHNNLGTIIVSAVLLLILAFAAYKVASQRKKGGCSCGCGCGDCPNSGLCHPAENNSGDYTKKFL